MILGGFKTTNLHKAQTQRPTTAVPLTHYFAALLHYITELSAYVQLICRNFSANKLTNVMAYMHITPIQVMLLLCLPLPQDKQHLTWRSSNRSATEPSIAAQCPTQMEHAKSSSLCSLLVKMHVYTPANYAFHYLNGTCT